MTYNVSALLEKKKPTTFSFMDKERCGGNGLISTFWGPPFWYFLNVICARAILLQSDSFTQLAVHILYTTQFVLPCRPCRVSLADHFKTLDFTMNTITKPEWLAAMIYSIHNRVNTLKTEKMFSPHDWKLQFGKCDQDSSQQLWLVVIFIINCVLSTFPNSQDDASNNRKEHICTYLRLMGQVLPDIIRQDLLDNAVQCSTVDRQHMCRTFFPILRHLSVSGFELKIGSDTEGSLDLLRYCDSDETNWTNCLNVATQFLNDLNNKI